ncbi:hypothetical protein I862_00830 [endosymbiont of Acanthamoeba sp. UWC8]|uniref:hypothetical protein n=1 Tax=endosymbiont of Acanthamoeba sp. UWC8 TaxID=86106 RepID=UPI0004D1414E|nr:hypothetical protein [endosymbiont of Acanthamoeba sp. UWC8]AIF80731.1 hypothetical protein I862_00830 [endosymbiont of Acanthamoeba sp. UWC8]
MKSNKILINGFNIRIHNLICKCEKEIINNILNEDIKNTITCFEKYKQKFEIHAKHSVKKFNKNAEDIFLKRKGKQIELWWSNGTLFYLAAINNSKDILKYFMQNKIFVKPAIIETKLYYEHILRNSLDLALKLNNKETALFLMKRGIKPLTRPRAFLDLALEYNKKEKVISLLEEGIKPLYKKGDHHSYIYKLNLYNALAAINNSPICLEYFSKASLANEILCEIASHVKPISEKNKALIEPLRQEIYEARVKTCKKVIPLLLGTVAALGLGMAFSPLETTMLCGVAGMMYFTYHTKFEKVGKQLAMPLIANISTSKTLIIMGEIDHGKISYLNKLSIYGMLSTVTVIPNIITLILEKATNNKPISYATSTVLSAMLPNLIYANLCRENCLNLSLNQHLLLSGFHLLISSLSLILGLVFKDESLIKYIATSTEEDRKIFADISYKTCISLKNYTMKGVSKFADRVSESLENIAEGVSDLQSNVMMR